MGSSSWAERVDTFKKIVKGEITIDEYLHPNKRHIIITGTDEANTCTVDGKKMNEAELDSWLKTVSKDRELIWFELDKGCAPLGTMPDGETEPAHVKKKDKKKKKRSFWEKLTTESIEVIEETKPLAIPAEIPYSDFIIENMMSLEDHRALNDEIQLTILRTFKIG